MRRIIWVFLSSLQQFNRRFIRRLFSILFCWSLQFVRKWIRILFSIYRFSRLVDRFIRNLSFNFVPVVPFGPKVTLPYVFVDVGARGECKSASFLISLFNFVLIRILDFVGRLMRRLPGYFDYAYKGNGGRWHCFSGLQKETPDRCSRDARENK